MVFEAFFFFTSVELWSLAIQKPIRWDNEHQKTTRRLGNIPVVWNKNNFQYQDAAKVMG